VPTMARMTTYDDQAVNDLVRRVRLQADESVPRLCCAIELELEDGQIIRHDQRMTTDDYAYDRQGVRALIRRVGAESGLSEEVFVRIENVVNNPVKNFGEVFRCFELARTAKQEYC